LKDSETRKTPFGAFRIHPPEEGKLPWWVQLYRHNESFNKWIDSEPNPLERLINPYPDLPRGTLPFNETAIRAAWDNEIREYGITDPPEYPYSRNHGNITASTNVRASPRDKHGTIEP